MPYKIGMKWKAQVRKDGQRMEKTFNTRKEAIIWEVEMRKKPANDWIEKTDMVCLIDWAEAYLDHAKVMFTNKTYKEKKSMFKRFFSKTDNTMPVIDLSRKIVMDYIREQSEQRSGYAANKDRKNLVAAWNWGTEYMAPLLPKDNPCKVKRMPEIRHPRYVPPEEDFWKVYEVAIGQDRVMLLTFLHLAARRGEIFRLTWQDIDFANNQIRLWTRKRKDGALEWDLLPMTKELRNSLRWWWEHRPIKEQAHVFLCLNDHPGQKDNYGCPFVSNQKFMSRLCKKAGVEPFGFHAIRHLTSTILYGLGYKVREIQPILRHKSPRTTELYLKSLGLEDLRATLENLSASSAKAEVIELGKVVASGEYCGEK